MAGKVDFSHPFDTSTLKSKSILITGGASGMGAEFARAFGEAGAYVTIVDIQSELGQKYAEELKNKGYHVKFVHTDVTNWASQISAFKVAIDHSPSKSIDTVVAAAGLNGHVTLVPSDEAPSLDRDPPEPSSKTIDANLTGVLYTTQLAWHYFQLKGSPESPDQSKKSIVLISSLAGYMELPGLADYQASKFGVRGIFKSLRTTLGRMGVRINLVAPWFVSTPMTKDIVPKLVEKGVPLAKMETAAEAVVRCAADDSIHGRAIAVVASGNFDLRDDAEGLDAGLEIEQFMKGDGKLLMPAIHDIRG